MCGWTGRPCLYEVFSHFSVYIYYKTCFHTHEEQHELLSLCHQTPGIHTSISDLPSHHIRLMERPLLVLLPFFPTQLLLPASTGCSSSVVVLCLYPSPCLEFAQPVYVALSLWNTYCLLVSSHYFSKTLLFWAEPRLLLSPHPHPGILYVCEHRIMNHGII